jgi:hypothetical protein
MPLGYGSHKWFFWRRDTEPQNPPVSRDGQNPTIYCPVCKRHVPESAFRTKPDDGTLLT